MSSPQETITDDGGLAPICWGPFLLDTARRRLMRGDEVLELQPRAFDVLLVLARRLDQAVPRSELLALAWPGVRVVDDALSQVIRKIRAALGDDSGEPRWLLTVPRHGYRLVSGEPEEVAAPSHALPHGWYGRADELGWFRAVVAGGGRTLTIAATGGYGKTALARRWLATTRGVVIGCSHLRTATELALAVARACGVPSDSAASVDVLARALASDGATMLLLDDADLLDPDGSRLASELAAEVPGLVRVHTSRAPLGLPDELVLPLAGLPPDDAVRMLADRVPAGWASEAVLREIAAAVDGSPLALELVAGRATFLSADELRARLVQPLDLLTRPTSTPPGRHDSVRACLALSHALLAPPAARAFAALSQFERAFSVQEAQRVSGATLDVLELLFLQRLVRREKGSLVLGHPERTYARERLEERPDRDELRERFRAEALAGDRPEDLLPVARDLSHPEVAACALLALFEQWQGGIGLRVLEPVARDLESVPLEASAQAVVDLVCASVRTGRDLAEARRRWRRLSETPDPDLAARGHLGLAGLAAAEERMDESEAHVRRALSLAVRPTTRTRGAILAAHVANREGRPVHALKLLLSHEADRGADPERSASEASVGASVTTRRTRAAWLAALASTRRHLGDSAGAEWALREALQLAEPASRVAAGLQVNLGGLQAERGALPEAAAAFEGALRAFRGEGDLRGQSECLYGLAMVQLALGELPAAESTLRVLHPLERALGSGKGSRRASVLSAAVALARGSVHEAVAHAELALDADDPQADADGRAVLALASARLGRPREVLGDGVWARVARAVLAGAPLPDAASAEALAARRALALGAHGSTKEKEGS